ncbi:MAG: glycosyltransferase [Candidatus Bathyarchaeia archaeon]
MLYLSCVPWGFLWSRPQQIPSRLAERGGINILYVQDPIYLIPRSLIASYRRKDVFLRKKVTDNLSVINLFLPEFSGRLKFLKEKYASMVLRSRLKYFNFKPEVAIFYSFSYAFLLPSLNSMNVKIVYDCPDDFSAFFSGVNVSKALRTEENLVADSSVVTAVSKVLCKRISKINSHCFYVPNGVDFDHFHRATWLVDKPQEISSLKHPIVGFVGIVRDWINVELVCKLAQSHPEYSILLIGPVAFGLEELQKYPNIIMLGARKYESLPSYLSCVDVCLIPFKINRLTSASNPIKLYEYLATGKPVVSTSLPEVCNNVSELVYIAKDDEDFIRKVEEAVDERKKPEYEALVARRIRFAQDNSWEKRVDVFERLLTQVLRSH